MTWDHKLWYRRRWRPYFDNGRYRRHNCQEVVEMIPIHELVGNMRELVEKREATKGGMTPCTS
jgi:hypothetical protein